VVVDVDVDVEAGVDVDAAVEAGVVVAAAGFAPEFDDTEALPFTGPGPPVAAAAATDPNDFTPSDSFIVGTVAGDVDKGA
jgi:hypothetical protein